MRIECPNINLPEWKTLAKAVGEDAAHLVFQRMNSGKAEGEMSEIPTPEQAKELLLKARREAMMAKYSKQTAPATPPPPTGPIKPTPTPDANKWAELVRKQYNAFVRPFVDAHDGMRRAFNPGVRSEAATTAMNMLRENIGTRELEDARRTTLIDKAVRETRKNNGIMAKAMDVLRSSGRNLADNYFGKRKQASNYAFMQWMSSGKETPNHPLTDVDRALGKIFDDINAEKAKAVQELGTGALQNLREHYWPGMWTKESIRAMNQALREAREHGLSGKEDDVNGWSADQKAQIKARVEELLSGKKGEDGELYKMLAHRPLEGSKSFTKQKTFDEFQTAVDFGLQPVSDNPMDIAALKWREMDKYIIAHRTLNALQAVGLEKFLPSSMKTPEGWAKIDDPYGTVFGPPELGTQEYKVGGFPIVGYRIVPEEIAQVINNYTSQTLYGNKYVGGPFRGYMSIANHLNQFQLGVGSAFHAGFTSLDVNISQTANGLKSLAKGDIASAAKYFAQASVSFLRSPFAGDKIIKQLRGEKAVTAEIAPIIEAMRLSGMKLSPDRQFTTDATQRMIEHFTNWRPIRGLANIPFAFVEQAARPIMEWLVPRQKAFVFGEMLNRWMRDNPNASHEDLVESANQIVNRVESRLGQVSYERLMVHNAAKNAVQAMIRAPGWTGGTILEVGGGMVDIARYMRDFAKNPKTAELSDRAAYTMSLFLTVGIANALLTKLFTGDDPDAKDLLAFRTGEKDNEGNDQRWMLPSYMKDIYAVASRGPGDVAVAKMHPAAGLIAEMIRNKNYYGRPITTKGDPVLTQIGQLGMYGLKAFEPFWIRGQQKMREEGASALSQAMPFIGIMPAPKSLTSDEQASTPTARRSTRPLVPAPYRPPNPYRSPKYRRLAPPPVSNE